MKYATTIIVWSKLGHTPLTKREGSFYDQLLRLDVECANPAEAAEMVRRLIKETEHGDNGYFTMPGFPNQNTNLGYIR